MTRHRHPRLLPQVRAGDQVLRLARMSANDFAALVEAGFQTGLNNHVKRERRARDERNPSLPPVVSTARTRRRERRRNAGEEKEQASQTA